MGVSSLVANLSSFSCMHRVSAAKGFSQSETASLRLKQLLLPLDLTRGFVTPCHWQPVSFME